MVLGFGTLLNRLSGTAVPLAVPVAAGLLIQVGIGAWFLASRAFGIDGAPLGSKGGAILALIADALVISLGELAGMALTALHPQ